jgi:oligoribonuclease
MSKELIVWLDLETTGLRPDKDSVVEVGWILTDTDLEEKAEGQGVVRYSEEELPGVIAQMDAYVTKMHTSSGLIEEMATATKNLLDLEWEILDVLANSQAKTFYLGGHSVHFDRGFVAAHMPRLHAKLSHRHFDVRVFEFAEKFWANDYLTKNGGVSNHRSMADVRYSLSIAQAMKARHY